MLLTRQAEHDVHQDVCTALNKWEAAIAVCLVDTSSLYRRIVELADFVL